MQLPSLQGHFARLSAGFFISSEASMTTLKAARPGRPMGRLHQEDVRAKIQASQLVNRLTDHVLGRTEMSPTQVQAAKILLGKTLPDLSAVELAGEGGGEIVHRVEFAIVDPKN
jgi:hypothetical protein